MTQEKFRIGITRDNLKADGDPIFDKALLGRLDDPRIAYEFLPQLENVHVDRPAHDVRVVLPDFLQQLVA